MQIHRIGSVSWTGGLKDGRGAITTQSGALAEYPYGFSSRFEGVAGSNPEELLAAAHAACFTMALTLILGEAGLKAERLDTKAVVLLEQTDQGFAIPKIDLSLTATIADVGDEKFQTLAGMAKANCPVSKLFNAEISLVAVLTA